MPCHACVAIKTDEQIIWEMVQIHDISRWMVKSLWWEGFVEQVSLKPRWSGTVKECKDESGDNEDDELVCVKKGESERN